MTDMTAEKETELRRTDTTTRITFKTSTILIRSRLEAMFIWSWNTCMACMIAGRGSPPLIPSVLSVTAVVFISLSVYLYNDLTDVAMDRLNAVKRNRPLPAGKASQENALKLVYLSGVTGLAIVLLADVRSFVFGLLYFVLFTVYSHPKVHLKKKFLFKESIIALGIPLTSLVGIYAVSDSLVAHAFFASILFAVFTYMAQPVLTDSIDVEEDRQAGVRSLATTLSWKRRVQLLVAGSLVIMGLIPLTYSTFGFNRVLPVYAVVGGIIFLAAIIPLLRTFEEAAVLKAKKIAYVFFILLQISFIIGSLDVYLFF